MHTPGGPGPAETRNIIIAVVLSAAILFGFEFFYNGPQREKMLAAQRAQQEETLRPQQQQSADQAPAADVQTGEAPEAAATPAPRIAIDTPSVDGSISLEGARLDDLTLRRYRTTVELSSPEVTHLSPMGSQYGHDAFFGWEMQSGSDVSTLADVASRWNADATARLTPQTPVTLTLQAGPNIAIERTISVDENYMFTITDVVRNSGANAVSVRPLGVVRRQGLPRDYVRNQIVHQGLIGAFGENHNLRLTTYQNADKHARERERGRIGRDQRIRDRDLQGTGGWFGITDHYWLTAIVPDQREAVSTYFDARAEGAQNAYRAAYRGDWHDVAAGGTVTYTQRLFAGAKRYEMLRDYQRGDGNNQAIPKFDDAIDWGMFWFLTRPFFQWLLHPLAQWFAGMGVIFNFGMAILASTVVIKLILFPLVYQSFKSMAKMRGLQPKMKEIQERYAADKQRQQQEMLKLYQTEKINPVAGCVPILLQIPVFYALYKTLSVTIEMRHAPFVGWIHDLSARDPTSIFNLFGLLPFEISPAFLGGALLIGAWPIMYGVSMWALQALSPPPTDPVQAQIFRFLPILFTVMFAAFPAGLVIYWTWSNTLSILQQYVIMRRQGVETQLDKLIKKYLDRDKGDKGHERIASGE